MVFLSSHSTIIILFFSLFFYPYFCVLGLLCKYDMCSFFVHSKGWCSVVVVSLSCSFTSFPLTLLLMKNNFSHVFLFLAHVVHVHVLFYFLLIVGIGSWRNVGYKCGSSLLSNVFDLDPCCCLLLPFSLLGFTIMVIIFAHLHPLLVLGNYKLIKWNRLSLW